MKVRTSLTGIASWTLVTQVPLTLAPPRTKSTPIGRQASQSSAEKALPLVLVSSAAFARRHAIVSVLELSDVKQIETVYFLTWTDVELDVCREILERHSSRITAA